MIHSVEFLDQAGNILSGTLVEAPDDPSAFRMVADYWPDAASCVRILAVMGTQSPPQEPPADFAPPAPASNRRRSESHRSRSASGRESETESGWRGRRHGRRWIGSTQ